MLTDDQVSALSEAVSACEAAREELETALDAAETGGGADEDDYESVASALADWREGQRQFMSIVERADVPDVATAAMLLKSNHGIDASEARRGVPGLGVEGTDKPADLDLSGTRGSILTTAAMEYLA
jgi:hypothetical protein